MTRRVEAAYSRQRNALRFPPLPHPRDVVADLIVACVVAHADKLPRFWVGAVRLPITTVVVAGVPITMEISKIRQQRA